MYIPKFNLATDRALLLEVMQTHSFAVLYGTAPGGAPTATHLPLVIKDEGPHGLIEGHFAKANPHWQSLAGRETLAVFSGPHAYVSPTNYAEELSVPTWNYIAVHAYGTLSLVEDNTQKDALLKGLIAQHEPAYADRWHALPEGFKRTMLAGIVGFRIPISRIEGKFKLSQNRPAGDRERVRATQSSASPDEQSLAAWMQRLGI
ncbi:MAG: FMN-binding negative transcriptional regulator [Acidobacteriota bacterium]|nr:FMN-binding negative transcriptional regulator [Acidobacteriota bacterium]